MGYWMLPLLFLILMLVPMAGIAAGAWAKVNQHRMDNALKQQMIDRGMSAEDIVKILYNPAKDQAAVSPPVASEVVVENDGEWCTGLVLNREGERLLIHFVGTDMSDNEWVTSDRVRFPATAENGCGSPWDWASAAGLGAGEWCANHSRAKPTPVDQDL
jgi:hypothetical protein